MKEQDLSEAKRQKLVAEKTKRIKELNNSFGIKEDEAEIEKVVETKPDIMDYNPNRLWEKLQGKGLVK